MNKKNDKVAVSTVFNDLFEAGFVTREDYEPDNMSAWLKLEKEHPGAENVIFYSQKGGESFDKKSHKLVRSLALAWSGNATTIINTLRKHGFLVSWNGNRDHLMFISPKQ